MKPNISKKYTIILLIIGLLLLFAMFKIANRPQHIIQENKYLDLKDYNYDTNRN